MGDRGELVRALAAAVNASGDGAAMAVCRALVEWLPMSGASITLMTGANEQIPVCATDATAARIDELQFSLGEGPCVESFTTGRTVLITDIADEIDRRWPVFAASAAETRARGMYVFPLQVGAARLGVLDCYRDTPGSLDDQELAGALQAVDAAVWMLLDRTEASTLDGEHTGWDWFDRTPLARAEVHQATGMLAVQADLTPAAGLARLRAAAFATGRPIAELAADVVARRLRIAADGSWQASDHHRPGDEEPADEENRS